jgi:hypothetical protein
MRSVTVLLVLSGSLVIGTASMARDLHLPKTSAAELKQICEKVGGSYSEGAGRYGCATDCKGAKGTDCIVSCIADKPCDAQVFGGKRTRTVEQALQPGKKK